MSPIDLLVSPPILFLLMLAAGLLVYAWAGRVAPPFHPTGAKAQAYTGGETLPGQTYQPGYQFFHAALFFTMLHIAALVVATAPPESLSWGAVGYLAILSATVGILRWGR